jgi:AcrR family transcriptional regulator
MQGDRVAEVQRDQVAEVQRARLLAAATRVVLERGYAGMTVARVTARARVSRKTFYELFEDREDCFLAAFEEAVATVGPRVVEAYQLERGWKDGIRSGLAALLGFFDEQPAIGSLCVVAALGAGPRVMERRAQILYSLMEAVDRGGLESGRTPAPPALTAEGVVGAVLSVVYSRMVERDSAERGAAAGPPLTELLGPLMSIIVLPYQGAAAARKEISSPRRFASREVGSSDSVAGGEEDLLADLNMRLTYRTLRVLATIDAHPGSNNREIASAAGIIDQGQASKLFTRLQRLGLIHNTGRGRSHSAPNAWELTPAGQQIEAALRVPSQTNRG